MSLKHFLFGATLTMLAYQCHASCSTFIHTKEIDAQQLWQDIHVLASDHMQGRQTNTAGAQLARNYIQTRYEQIGLLPFNKEPEYFHPFHIAKPWAELAGVNVVGFIEGATRKHEYIVVSAHYDHLGKKGRQIFNGADDNASGVAAMINIAAYVTRHGSKHSIIFLASDAEELGLHGSKVFVSDPPIPLSAIKFNLNLDMLAEGGRRKKLYVTHSRGDDRIDRLVDKSIKGAGLCLVKGHRRSQRGYSSATKVNWRKASDHASFASKNIPYLFVGVGVHRRYHTQRDTTNDINKGFYTAAVETSLSLLKALDSL